MQQIHTRKGNPINAKDLLMVSVDKAAAMFVMQADAPTAATAAVDGADAAAGAAAVAAAAAVLAQAQVAATTMAVAALVTASQGGSALRLVLQNPVGQQVGGRAVGMKDCGRCGKYSCNANVRGMIGSSSTLLSRVA